MSRRLGIAVGGFMGVGKSSVGTRVANVLGLPFVDTDARLVAMWGPIEQQFSAHGEARFREREREVVLGLCDGVPRVLSTGGGVWPRDELREALATSYRTVVLTARLEVIRRRIAGDESRPLAGDLERLYRRREAAYRRAELVIDTSGMALGDVVEEVVAWARQS